MESLLKKKKSAKGQEQTEGSRTTADQLTQEIPADPPPPEVPAEQPSPHDPIPRERPRIKTREAVSTRESGAGSGPSPGERMKQRRIKTRKSALHDDPRPDVSPAPQTGSGAPQIRTRESTAREIPADEGSALRVRSEPPKIKTRDVATSAPSGDNAAPPAGHRPGTPDRLAIKTREACIQSQPVPEQPPQALVQGGQEFVRERGRAAAMKRAEGQQGAMVKRLRPLPLQRGGDMLVSGAATPRPRLCAGRQVRENRTPGLCGMVDGRSSKRPAPGERPQNAPPARLSRRRNAPPERPSKPPSGRRKLPSRRSKRPKSLPRLP